MNVHETWRSFRRALLAVIGFAGGEDAVFDAAFSVFRDDPVGDNSMSPSEELPLAVSTSSCFPLD